MPRFLGTQIFQTICKKTSLKIKLFNLLLIFISQKREVQENKKKRKKSKPNDQEEEVKLNEFKVTTHLNK